MVRLKTVEIILIVNKIQLRDGIVGREKKEKENKKNILSNKENCTVIKFNFPSFCEIKGGDCANETMLY